MSAKQPRCGNCGNPVSGDDQFCGNCGTRISHGDIEKGDFADKSAMKWVESDIDAPVPPEGVGKDEFTGRDAMEWVESDIEKHEPMGISDLDEEICKMEADLEAAIEGRKKPAKETEREQPQTRAEQGFSPSAPQFMQVRTRDLKVEVEYMAKVNFSLIHNKIPLIRRIRVENTAHEDAESGLIKCWIADYGEPWQQTFSLPLHSAHVFERINVPIRRNLLQEMREAEKAFLKVEIHIDDNLCFSDTYPIEMLAYNEWFYHPDLLQLLATFIRPNDPAVDKIINFARNHLRELAHGNDSFDGYQSGSPKKVHLMLEAIFLAMQQDLDIGYINPPPSFERTGQKICAPAQILENCRGTCLDLALLYAACLERVGLHPVIFLIEGHAFLGCVMGPKTFKKSVITDPSVILKALKKNRLVALNSTTFTLDDRNFQDCQQEGSHLLLEGTFLCAVDVVEARNEEIKPLP